jgi:hypothetical protein
VERTDLTRTAPIHQEIKSIEEAAMRNSWLTHTTIEETAQLPIESSGDLGSQPRTFPVYAWQAWSESLLID